METTSILWIQKISFVQLHPAHVGFLGFLPNLVLTGVFNHG